MRAYFGLEINGLPKKAKVRANFVTMRIHQVVRRAGAAFIVREKLKLERVEETQYPTVFPFPLTQGETAASDAFLGDDIGLQPH